MRAERALVAGGGFRGAGFRARGECLAAERAGLLVVTEEAVVLADCVERFGLSRLVADGLIQAQRLLGVPERVGVAALTSGREAEIVSPSSGR